MTTYLPKEVRDGLLAAQKTAFRKRNRLRVVIGVEAYPIRRLWDHGFAVEREGVPQLRGLVDVYDGGRHLWQCLIVAAAEDGDEMQYEFKRQTMALDAAPIDFARDENAPAGLLARE